MPGFGRWFEYGRVNPCFTYQIQSEPFDSFGSLRLIWNYYLIDVVCSEIYDFGPQKNIVVFQSGLCKLSVELSTFLIV